MNFSSLFKSFSNFQFPYTIEDRPIHETPLWQVFHGTRKSDSLPVTIFKGNRTHENEKLILNAVHKSKVLKIPGLCNVLETFDSDPQSTFIITEHVIPFPWDKLSDLNQNKQSIQLGISQILNTMKILNTFVLGTLTMSNIYLNTKGEWLIFGLELCVKKSEFDANKFISSLELYTLMAKDGRMPSHRGKMIDIDSTLVSKLIENVLGDSQPRDWQPLTTSLSKGQITITEFVEKLHDTQSWFANPLISLYEEFKEFHIKDPEGKLVVMTDVENLFLDSKDSFTNLVPGFLENLIIPELSNMIGLLMAPATNSPFSSPIATNKLISFIAILLSLSFENKIFNNNFNEIIFLSFKLQDRQIRFLLLVYFPKLMNLISDSDASNKIYPHFIQGLTDSDSLLRLQTLKSIPLLTPKLTERQLNNELLRYLAKTQVDQDIEIRTWTIVILTKIASSLARSTRSNILATAFTKSLKDPDIKPRLASLYGLAKSIDLFEVNTIANKILTVIAPGLLDKEPLVRFKAKNLFEKYLNKLENEAKLLQDENLQVDKSKDIDFDKYESGINVSDSDHVNDEMITQFMNTLRIHSLETNKDLLREISHNQQRRTESATTINNNSNDMNDAFDFDNEDDDNGWNDFNDETDSTDDLTNSQFFNKPVKITKSWNDELNADSKPFVKETPMRLHIKRQPKKTNILNVKTTKPKSGPISHNAKGNVHMPMDKRNGKTSRWEGHSAKMTMGWDSG
ncbi:COPI-interacting protein CEX1 NDAI_0B04280 [Naumovozyma dairenensis CBS 421]|uniref:Protein kinase domain-containing protein n=1 Tax=Naumovozyma dairenensis (strain ATCC 10597 / BCRC 20456 / CBS 421 / NBRC 0211 / NRRL Y-12639) TaxID=1071378 RepID=G0W6Q1_NAUDC|nr:hypothetical protein NDAI_0B04280 [Naumovozyma dairenensis CBS 421]CCD23462.1 hypothetical protein NDAI_0B04280 [Naumovozyma dairenensis CBS 421]